MKDYEKKCPLMRMTCYEDECGLWNYDQCCLLTLARKAEDVANELYMVRKDLGELERRL